MLPTAKTALISAENLHGTAGVMLRKVVRAVQTPAMR
jgi:hypothetical protein